MAKKSLLSFSVTEYLITILLYIIFLIPGIIYLVLKTPCGKFDIIGIILFALGIIPGIIYILIMKLL